MAETEAGEAAAEAEVERLEERLDARPTEADITQLATKCDREWHAGMEAAAGIPKPQYPAHEPAAGYVSGGNEACHTFRNAILAAIHDKPKADAPPTTGAAAPCEPFPRCPSRGGPPPETWRTGLPQVGPAMQKKVLGRKAPVSSPSPLIRSGLSLPRTLAQFRRPCHGCAGAPASRQGALRKRALRKRPRNHEGRTGK